MKRNSNPYDPTILNKISNLKIKSKVVAQGVISGIHKSRFKGSSVEFLEHKKYSQGDDVRQIDWRLFARSDKHYIKEFEDETNIRVCFIIDISGSMAYRSIGVSKLEYAITLAASLSYLFINQSDSVGLFTCNNDVVNFAPPATGYTHFRCLTDSMEALCADGKTSLSDSLIAFSKKMKKPCKIIVISDFFDDIQKITKILRQLVFKKSNVVLFQTLDTYELEFPFENPTNFVSMEDEKSVSVNPKLIKEAYKDGINNHLKKLKQTCLSNRINYKLVNTSMPVEQIIIDYCCGIRNI